MDENREKIMKKLDKIWEDSPAYMIDWFRDNVDDIIGHIKRINELIYSIPSILNVELDKNDNIEQKMKEE
jgi:hypothetical protein